MFKFTLDEISKDDIVQLAVKIYKEIAKRKKEGRMNYTVSPKKSKPYKALWDEVIKYLTDEEIRILTSDAVQNKSAKLKPGYYSRAKPYYRFYLEELEGNIRAAGWDEKQLLIDIKADGLRVTAGKVNGKGFVYVDPEDVKEKNPDVSNRLPTIIKELEEHFPDNTILDGELIALHPNKKETLHRTVINSILNSKIPAEKLSEFAVVFVFDVLFFEGQDIRIFPLHERLEYLSQLKSTDHIWIERVSKNLDKSADAYVVNGKDFDKILAAINKIFEHKIDRPKFIAEGVMIKTLDNPYEEPINHGWAKLKKYYEMDLRVLDKHLVKRTKDVYNYKLGYDISHELAAKFLEKTTKDWYGKVACIVDGKTYWGRDTKEFLGNKQARFTIYMGKSDNHKETQKVNIGDIIRIAAEEVLKYEHPDGDLTRYAFYIGRVLEPVPEKTVTDTIDVIDKLASFEPKRIPVEELRHLHEELQLKVAYCPNCNEIILDYNIKYCPVCYENLQTKKLSKEIIKEWVLAGKIPEEEYKKLAKKLEPLPPELYIDYDESELAWAQFHYRGLEDEDVEKFKLGKISLAELIKGHSVHCLTGDTSLFIRDGYGRIQIRTLEKLLRTNIFPEVLTPKGWKKVRAFIYRGKETVYKIKLRNGVEIKATPDHLHLIYRNFGHKGKHAKWKLLTVSTPELRAGDALMFTTGYDGDDIGDYNFGRFLGLFTGDGTYYKDHLQFTFAENETEYAQFIYNYASKLGAKCKIFKDKDKSALRIRCYSAGLASLIRDYVKKDKTFTWRVWRLSPDARRGILEGMWEADGRKNGRRSLEIGIRNKTLRDQLSFLAASLGLPYTIRNYDNEYRIIIIIHPDKYNFTRIFIPNIPSVKIDSIEVLPDKQDVYDLTVDDIPAFTLANGIVTHNCDLRLKFKDKFIQWVVLQDHPEDYLDTLIGRRDPDTGNVSKGLCVVKISAEEPSQEIKKPKEKEPILDDEGAKLLASYDLPDKSFIIPAGDVGACLSKSAKVLTNRGLLNITEVREGDLVIGHDGKLHKVEKTIITKPDNRKAYVFKFKGKNKFIATYNHPFLIAIRKIYKDPLPEIKELKWMTAEELYRLKLKHKGYFHKRFAMAIPKSKDGYRNDDYFDGLIVGFILGDGYIRKSTPNDGRIELYLNAKTEEWIASLLAFVLDSKGIELRYDRTKKNTLQYHIIGLKYIKLIDYLLEKPERIFEFKKEFAEGVISGLSLSDGEKNIDRCIRITQKKENVNKLIPLVAYHADYLFDYSTDSRDNKILSWHLSRYYVDSGEYMLKSFDIEEYGIIRESYNLTIEDVNSYLMPFCISHNTAYKSAYLSCIWIGKVKALVQRPDLHEYILIPDKNMPKKNQKLFNGRFIIRCFKTPQGEKRWWIWKAINDPYPMDSIEHSDCGHYYPIKAEKLEKLGREAYREESKRKFLEKLSRD